VHRAQDLQGPFGVGHGRAEQGLLQGAAQAVGVSRGEVPQGGDQGVVANDAPVFHADAVKERAPGDLGQSQAFARGGQVPDVGPERGRVAGHKAVQGVQPGQGGLGQHGGFDGPGPHPAQGGVQTRQGETQPVQGRIHEARHRGVAVDVGPEDPGQGADLAGQSVVTGHAEPDEVVAFPSVAGLPRPRAQPVAAGVAAGPGRFVVLGHQVRGDRMGAGGARGGEHAAREKRRAAVFSGQVAKGQMPSGPADARPVPVGLGHEQGVGQEGVKDEVPAPGHKGRAHGPGRAREVRGVSRDDPGAIGQAADLEGRMVRPGTPQAGQGLGQSVPGPHGPGDEPGDQQMGLRGCRVAGWSRSEVPKRTPASPAVMAARRSRASAWKARPPGSGQGRSRAARRAVSPGPRAGPGPGWSSP
jgi:hypothetical protein